MERITNIARYITGIQNIRSKVLITLFCICFYPLHVGFYKGCDWYDHVLYNVCHVNIFHLLVNLLVLWSIKNKIRPISSLSIAVLSSFLPMYVDDPTMGLSGFLFASFGQMWGRLGRHFDAMKAVLPFILFTMLLHNVNGVLHLWCFVLGYFFMMIVRIANHNFI